MKLRYNSGSAWNVRERYARVIRAPIESPTRLGGVRRSVWALLIAAVVLALLVPGMTLWRAAHAALDARACVWPAVPTVGQPAELHVTLPEATDRADVGGPWGKIVAAWDMPTMRMQEQREAMSGDSTHSGAYVLPLTLQMAGPWRIRVALHTPGRPDWSASLALEVRNATAVLSPDAAALTGTPPSGGSSPSTCTSV